MQANSRHEDTEAQEAARDNRPTHVELLRQELREAEAEIERLQAIVGDNDELTTVIDRGEPEERFAIPPNPDPLVLAREIKRIDALGGRRDKDETARLLYNAADVCHDWDKAKRGGGAEVRMNEARAMARLVDGWIDEMFPSQEACDAAERMGHTPQAGEDTVSERRPSIAAQVNAMLGRHGLERTITLETGIYHVRFEFKGRGNQALSAVSYDPLVLGAMDGLRLLEGVEIASLALRLGAPDVGGEDD